MTKRKPVKKPPGPPPDATPEQLAESRRREALMETAALAADMAAVQELQRSSTLPSGRELSRIARHLRNRRDLCVHPVMEPFLNAILDRLVADNPAPAPGSDAKAIMVKWWMSGKNAVSPGEARRRVAEFWGIAVTAVKEAHLQYLRRWR